MHLRLPGLIILLMIIMTSNIACGESFADQQKRYPRVRAARNHMETKIDSLFKASGLDYPPEQIFIRAFKFEQELELWAGKDNESPFVLIKTFPFTATSGTLGPKRQEGDLQIPEGFYVIDWFNPASKYHLSMRVNYPNKSDKKRATSDRPGGSIFIHGNWVTIGCIPLGDFPIEELYIICVDARDNGQERIPAHIFPCRMDTDDGRGIMKRYIEDKPGLRSFWDEIRPGYDYFESNRRLPEISVDYTGKYKITAPE